MNDRIVWIAGVVIVVVGLGMYVARSQTSLPDRDSFEGAQIFGSQGAARGHIPSGWRRPPPIGSDPDYQGPDPSDPMRYSPYAMSTSTRVRRRGLPRDNGDPGMVEAVRAATFEVAGDIGYLGPDRDDRFEDLGRRLRDVSAAVFEGADPVPAYERLRRDGFTWLIASTRDPEPQPWMQLDAAGLRVRLRDGLPLSHFHPVIFGRSHILYRLAPPMEISAAERQRITQWVRARLVGGDPGPLGIDKPTDSVGRDEHRAIISLRSRRSVRALGRRIASASGSGSTLEAALTATMDQLGEGWLEDRAEAIDAYRVTFPESLAEAVGDMEIAVEVMDRMCHIIDRHEERLLWQYEIGLEGLYYEREDSFHYLSPATAIHLAFRYYVTEDGERRRQRHFAGERTALTDFLRRSNLSSDAWNVGGREGTERGPYAADFGRFESHYWLERGPSGEVVSLYRAVPLVGVDDISRDSLIQSLRLGAMWLVNNQLDDGQFRYRYEAVQPDSSRRWISGNNIVRHALNPYTLLLVNRVAPDERLVQAARRGMAYTIEHLRREGDRCYIWHRDVPAPYENAKMGTVAVTILSILAMADAMDISDYEGVLSCLAEELLYMQDPNGHFRQYDVPPDHDYYGCENTIFPGEIQLALARVYQHTGDERYREAFARAFDWYKRWWEINVSDQTRDGIYNEEQRMNLVGFVPWNVMALNEMHRQTEEQRYADFAFELQDWMDDTFLFDLDRTSYPDYLGAYYKHHAELPAINSSGYTEGAGAAYDLALRTNHDVERRRQVLILGARFAMQIQYEGYPTTYFLPDPRTAMGGYRYNLNFARLRNDYSYHAMSALSQALSYLRPQDYPSENPILLPPTLDQAQGSSHPETIEETVEERPLPDGGPDPDVGVGPDAAEAGTLSER